MVRAKEQSVVTLDNTRLSGPVKMLDKVMRSNIQGGSFFGLHLTRNNLNQNSFKYSVVTRDMVDRMFVFAYLTVDIIGL